MQPFNHFQCLIVGCCHSYCQNNCIYTSSIRPFFNCFYRIFFFYINNI